MSVNAQIHGPLSFGSLTGFDTGTQHITPVAKSIYLVRVDMEIAAGKSWITTDPVMGSGSLNMSELLTFHAFVSDLISSRTMAVGDFDPIARAAISTLTKQTAMSNLYSPTNQVAVDARGEATVQTITASGLSFDGTFAKGVEYKTDFGTDGAYEYCFTFDASYSMFVTPLCQFKTGW